MSNASKRFLASDIMEEMDKLINQKILLRTAHMSSDEYARINKECDVLKKSIAENLLRLAE